MYLSITPERSFKTPVRAEATPAVSVYRFKAPPVYAVIYELTSFQATHAPLAYHHYGPVPGAAEVPTKLPAKVNHPGKLVLPQSKAAPASIVAAQLVLKPVHPPLAASGSITSLV